MPEHIEEHPRGEPGPGEPRETPAPDGAPSARSIARSAVKGFGISIVLVFGAIVWGTCFSYIRATTPPKEWRNDAFVLEGEFGADGSCTVRLDGRAVEGMAGAHVAYDTSAILLAAPEGYNVHQVACNVPVPGAPNPYYGQRDFWVWGPVPAGRPLSPGRYRITEEAISTGDTTAWEATLFDPRFDEQRAYLVGYQGYLRIVRADGEGVAGTFRIVARRVLRGPFE